jgi:hypothetical protein
MKTRIFSLVEERAVVWHASCYLSGHVGPNQTGRKIQEFPALKRGEGITTMSVQKKSLVSSQPAEKKVTAEPVKGTDAIGEPKSLTANALRPPTAFRSLKKSARATAMHSMKGKR